MIEQQWASRKSGRGTGLTEGEREATRTAERLVPVGVHVVMRSVRGLRVEEAVEERSYVVGVVAPLLYAGARHSVGGEWLVLRCEGETTMVRALP